MAEAFAEKGRKEEQTYAFRVNPEKCPSVDAEAGQVFIDWPLSDQGQAAIGAYRLDGRQLFFPNAERTG